MKHPGQNVNMMLPEPISYPPSYNARIEQKGELEREENPEPGETRGRPSQILRTTGPAPVINLTGPLIPQKTILFLRGLQT